MKKTIKWRITQSKYRKN